MNCVRTSYTQTRSIVPSYSSKVQRLENVKVVKARVTLTVKGFLFECLVRYIVVDLLNCKFLYTSNIRHEFKTLCFHH